MRYRIIMHNGDVAEADTLTGMLNAAATMWQDSGYAILPSQVEVADERTPWATIAAITHCVEVAPRTADTDLEEDR